MIRETFTSRRDTRHFTLEADLVITGGGVAGACAAITAARAGIKVILASDRPVLGGNASSEVRLWILGATSHMGNNNRWAREGGVIDEILVENMGHINFAQYLIDRKGITDRVTLNGMTLMDWETFNLPLTAPPTAANPAGNRSRSGPRRQMFCRLDASHRPPVFCSVMIMPVVCVSGCSCVRTDVMIC